MLGRRSPEQATHVRVDEQDHVCRVGVAFLAASEANVAWYTGHEQFASIGPDKVNQLRHVEFFGSAQGVRDHMAKHRAIPRPEVRGGRHRLSTELAGLGIADWSKPTGGYFVNLDVLDGRPRAWSPWPKEAGIVLTPAGASYPWREG